MLAHHNVESQEGFGDWHVWELLKGHAKNAVEENVWDAKTEVGDAETVSDPDHDFDVWEFLMADDVWKTEDDEKSTTEGDEEEPEEEPEEDIEEDDEEDEEPECFMSPPLIRNHMVSYSHICGMSSFPEFDLGLLGQLFNLMGAHVEGPLTNALGTQFGAEPMEVACAVRLLMRCLKLLHDCDFAVEDIEVVTAHASSYLQRFEILSQEADKPRMKLLPLARTLCALIYIACAHALDNGSPKLAHWHKNAFYGHCTMEALTDDVWSLLSSLKFVLRVDTDELDARLDVIRCSDDEPPAVASTENALIRSFL